MPELNQVNLMGNLTRDPELRYLPKGTPILEMGMALNRKWKTESGEKKEEVTFIDVTMFGKTAENAAQYCRKGRAIYIGGRLKQETWEDKTTHQKRSKIVIIADNWQLLGGKDGAAPAGAPSGEAAQAGAAPAKDKDDSEVPF